METSRINKILKTNLVLILSVACLISFSACTKKIPYEGLPVDQKEKDVSRALLDSNSEYLYSASQQNASRSATDAFPYQSGDNKRVKLELTKESLRVVEVEKDERFSSNTMNNKLVLEIPVDYVQYGCKKDRFGECTNTEEENTDLDWTQKDTVRIKLDKVKTGELELLPILSSAVAGSNCYENVTSRLIQSNIEKDAINFQIERTFKTRIGCLSDESTSLSDATISAVYHYSLVKISSIISPDYKIVSYPEGSKDEQSFGFFSSQRTRLDVDNNNTENSSIQVMNRWNPNRSEILYYLSDEFAKPENKMLKDLTFKAVGNINKGLEQAGVKFRINLKEPSGKVPGDIRNSMIILVEDPVASSVIGYGPQTEDPVTGEIVSARTVMFLGTIKKFAKYTYDEIIREKQSQKKTLLKVGFSLAPELTQLVDALKKSGQVFGSTELLDKISAKIANPETKSLKSEKLEIKQKALSSRTLSPGILAKPQIQKAIQNVQNYTLKKNEEFSGHNLQSQIKYLQEAKNCAFAPVMEAATGGISEKLMSEFPDNAKPWTELSDSEKEKALELILPEIWIPTLVHELGHNLGLRHNFAASEDKNNFYSTQELTDIGVDHSIPFSSVMDYGNDLKTLPVLGTYDIAALRFGYLRKVSVVEAEKESVVDIPSTLENLSPLLTSENKEIKEYKYCTDEHTGINAGCKRFDLGTSYTEIVQNLIKDYETAYSTRNLRDGRASFSLMSDLKYIARINSIFKELRIMMESVERIKYDYKVADDAEEWESVPFLKDLRQAATLGGSFLTNVLLVPDTLCAVAKADKPQEIIAVISAAQIDPKALNCKDLALNPQFKVVGQAGKSLNSKKDPNNRNPYVDQIDIRGIWLDKVAAIQTLTARTIDVSTMNNHTDNFLNLPELRPGIVGAIQALMLNNVVNKIEFTMNDGTKQKFEVQYDMNDSQLIAHPLIVDAFSRSSSDTEKQKLLKRIGVQEVGTTPFKKIVAEVLGENSVDPNGVNTDDNSLRDLVSVHKFSSVSDVQIKKNNKIIQFDGVQYVADNSNLLAAQSIKLIPYVRLMAQIDPEILGQILEMKKNKEELPALDEMTDEAKANYETISAIHKTVGIETIEHYLLGLVKDEKFYQDLLKSLPTAK
jgi:hypothetical protein